ncbi:glycosyltransferase family 4 protein [Muribaculum intestinale]|uniref:glycosyltransferase family 4 protein n=1 Tax=Muribaculum intestinale TaxID=1796646 RepID=UPI0025AA284C|nr:glycosyltransferase family 4 protein [Muribaculum intestinale]
MKILWVNPSFLDYRIPLYKALNEHLDGRFHLLYSKERIPARCHAKVRASIGDNAHFIDKEKKVRFGKADSEFANTSVSIPIPIGLYSQIKRIKPSQIIAEGFFQFTPWALAYSFIHRVPLYIAYERTAHTERNCPWWRKLYRRFVGLFVKGYIANGVLTKEYLVSQGVNLERIYTGGMCADSENLRLSTSSMTATDKDEFEKSIGLEKINGIRYIYVGQIIQRKGVNHLLDAWREHEKKYTEDQLLIVGSGEYLNQYRESYSNLQSVKFLGAVDYSIIFKYYGIADVFVIPTLEDNWSLVVPEAMACGLPIACSIYNGCHPELVKKDYNGITFDPLSINSTKDALAYFQSKDLKLMGANSIILEEQFNPEKTSQNIINMLNNCR